MEWNYKQIRKNSWDTTFRRGRQAWLSLVGVCFLLAFIGVTNASQTSFINTIDQLIGSRDDLLPGNIDFLKQYIVTTPVVRDIPFITSELAMSVIDRLSSRFTWIIRLLAANQAYFERNPGEVVANLLLTSFIAAAVRILVLNVMLVGRDRYVMETRFQKKVRMRRLIAPFHRENLWNIRRVMFCYHFVMVLWSLTIIGGIYKNFQYSMVPFILAENPSATWREAKKLSASMTKGYKWKMFLTWLSYVHIWILKAFPLAGLCVAVPLEAELDAEMYFTLRENPAVDRRLFIEPTFSGLPVTQTKPVYSRAIIQTETPDAPVYLLRDPDLEPPKRNTGSLPYSPSDAIFFFFTFCFGGWVWEVMLHLVQEGDFANRGTMYGPWIPIYGVGGTAVIFLFDRYKENKAKLLVRIIALCAVLEYLSSFLLDFLFNSSYWDYKTMLLNINGRICLAGLLAFGIGGMFGIYAAAPWIANLVDRLSQKKRTALAIFLTAAFLTDLVCCLIFGFNTGAGVGGTL